MGNALRTENNSTVRRLLESRALVKGSRLPAPERVLPTGLLPLDEFLPHRGLIVGSISEWVGQGVSSLAAYAMARQSRQGPVAWLAPAGVLNPEWLLALGARLEQCYFAEQISPERFGWMVEQVVGSGVFPLVVVWGSEPESGKPLLSDTVHRRLLGFAKHQECAVLILLKEHDGLGAVVRSCTLRLRVRGPGTTGYHLELLKCAGHPPGARGWLSPADLEPLSPLDGLASSPTPGALPSLAASPQNRAGKRRQP